MRTGIIPYLKWRLLDNTGKVIVDPLPHPHQSRYEVWGMQPGMPGAATIGNFSIPLFPPSSDQYKLAKIDYDKITYAQRAEAYLSASPQDVAGAWGDPKFSGAITRTQKDTTTYSIEGEDSLWWAQKSMTGRTDLFSDTTDKLIKLGMKAYAKVYADGDQTISTSWTSGNYTNDGTWTFNVSDDGFRTAKAGAGGDGLLYTTTSYGNTNYADMYVEASFHLHCDTVSGRTSEASVIAAVADANNFIMGQVLLRQVTTTSWSVSPAIWQKSGGVYALGITAQAFTVNTADRRLQVRLVGYQKSSTVYSWRVLVNGTDTNCLWDQTVGVGAPTGAIGMRSSQAGSGVNSNAWAAQLVFMNKTRIFQDGTIVAGATTLNEVLSSMPLLDLWNIAATVENYLWRKNPKAASTTTPFPDTVDFATSPGTDRSASIVFKEGENLSNATISPNAEGLATAITVQGTGSMDGSGQFNYYNIAKINSLGLLIDSASAQGISDNIALRQYAARILGLRSNPSAAITATVVRDSDTVDGWRELDTVSITSPRLYLQNSSQQVVGYTLQEGVPTQRVTFAQYPSWSRWMWIKMLSTLTYQLRQKPEIRGVV